MGGAEGGKRLMLAPDNADGLSVWPQSRPAYASQSSGRTTDLISGRNLVFDDVSGYKGL